MKLTTNDLCFILNESIKKLLNEITVKDGYETYYNNIPEDTFNTIVTKVQGDNNILLPDTKIVLDFYKNEGEALLNNMDEFVSALNLWKRAKTRGMLPTDMCNLKWFRTSEEFIGIMNSINRDSIEQRTKGELSKDINNAKNDIDVVYEDNEWFVLTPNSYEASCYWGSKTEWCTATRETDEHYKRYTADGNKLFININKNTKAKYQFAISNNEFRDAKDESIDCPVLETIGASEGLIDFYQSIVKEDTTAYNLMFTWNISFEGDWIEIAEDYGIREVSFNGKYRFINENYKFLEELDFDSIESVNASMLGGGAIVVIDGKYYFYSFSKWWDGGHGISSDGYDFIDEFIPTGGFTNRNPNLFLAMVEQDGKYNFINGFGKLTSDIWFDNIEEDFSGSGYARAISDETLFLIDKLGKVTRL